MHAKPSVSGACPATVRPTWPLLLLLISGCLINAVSIEASRSRTFSPDNILRANMTFWTGMSRHARSQFSLFGNEPVDASPGHFSKEESPLCPWKDATVFSSLRSKPYSGNASEADILLERLCATQTQQATFKISLLPGPDPYEQPPLAWHLMSAVGCLTTAATTGLPMMIGSGGKSLWSPDDTSHNCVPEESCLFQHFHAARQWADTGSLAEWAAPEITEYYLRGAGLLELKQSMFKDKSGCWLVGKVLYFLMQPSDILSKRLQALLEAIHQELHESKLVCIAPPQEGRVSSKKDWDKYMQLPAVLSASKLLLLSNDGLLIEQWLAAYPDVDFLNPLMVDTFPPLVQDIYLLYTAAECDVYVGDVRHMWARVALLLRHGKYGTFPEIHDFDSMRFWADPWGMLACTPNEFSQDMSGEGGSHSQEQGPSLPTSNSLCSESPGCAEDRGDIIINAEPDRKHTTLPVHVGRAEDVRYLPQIQFSDDFNTACTMHHRAQNFRGDESELPFCCGYQTPSWWDHLRSHIPLKACRMTVLTIVTGGHDKLYQPQGQAKASTCYIAVMDAYSAVRHGVAGVSSKSGLLQYGLWDVPVVMSSPYWDRSNPHWSPRKDLNIIKHLPQMLFPDAEFWLWLDGKAQLKVDAHVAMQRLLTETNRDMAVFQHPNRNDTYAEIEVESTITGAKRSADHPIVMQHLKPFLTKDSFPEGAGLFDLIVIAQRNTKKVAQFNCALFSETHRFSDRNQVHFNYVLWRTGMDRNINYAPTCALNEIINHCGHA